MKPLALVLAAITLGTGCVAVDDSDPVGTLDVAWFFVRTKHDASTLSYTCADAGVDRVVVSSSRGRSYDLACRSGNFDGAVFTVPAGTQTLTITGYRGNAALYQSIFSGVSVGENATTPLDADVWGIPDDLEIYAFFRSSTGADVGWETCQAAGVAWLSWSIVDWAGTIVDETPTRVPCTNPAGVTYAGASALDRDQYIIRMQGFPAATGGETFDSATTRVNALVPTCDGQAFNHYGASVGTFGWPVVLFDVTPNATICL